MRETVITPAHKRRELYILAGSFLFAFVLNIMGITKFDTRAIELVTQIPIVLLITVLIYMALGILRIIYYLISLIWKQRN